MCSVQGKKKKVNSPASEFDHVWSLYHSWKTCWSNKRKFSKFKYEQNANDLGLDTDNASTKISVLNAIAFLLVLIHFIIDVYNDMIAQKETVDIVEIQEGL